jgi:hypothetical protein
VNLYGYANGDPVNSADPFGLCVPMPWCLLAVAGGGTVAASGGISALGPVAIAGALTTPASGAALGLLGAVMLAPAFPGAGEPMSRGSEIAVTDATAVFNRREGKQIRAAITSATGAQATKSQYDCMSQFIHECKESGEGGSKNKKGDFTWDELKQMAADLFGRKP